MSLTFTWNQVLIEKLNVLGERIKELEIQKQSAVEEEDYDTAKMLKVWMPHCLILNEKSICHLMYCRV